MKTRRSTFLAARAERIPVRRISPPIKSRERISPYRNSGKEVPLSGNRTPVAPPRYARSPELKHDKSIAGTNLAEHSLKFGRCRLSRKSSDGNCGARLL